MSKSEADNMPVPTGSPAAFNALVGSRVREAREDLGWSLRELAGRAGISHAAIHLIERGSVTPTVLSLARIAEATGQEPGWFFGGGWPR